MSAYSLRPRAEADLAQASAWIYRDNPAAAGRFLDAAQQTFDLLGEWPLAYPLARMRSRRLKSMRYAPLMRPFNKWLVFYCPGRDGVEIVRVIYGAMDWRSQPAKFR